MNLENLVEMYNKQITSAADSIKDVDRLGPPKRRIGKLLSTDLLQRLDSAQKLASKLDKANKRISDRVDEES